MPGHQEYRAMSHTAQVARPGGAGRTLPVRPVILVVDDQPSNIHLLYEMLKSDYEIRMALSGEQALALCAAWRPDLILLDVVMPEMGGYEVCHALKRHPQTADIPVIFVTAQNSPLEEARGLEVGAVDFISRPLHEKIVRARVRTHVTLAFQAEEFHRFASCCSDLIIRFDLAFGGRYVSPACHAIVGYTPDQLAAMPETALLHPDDVERYLALRGALLENAEIGRLTTRLRHVDGSWIWVDITLTRACDPATGKPAEIWAAVRDISVQMAAHRALLESEERYRLLVGSLADQAVLMLDRDGMVASWNPGAERLEGYLVEEVLDRHFSLFYPRDDVAAGAPLRALQAALATGQFSGETWLVRKDASRYLGQVTINPVNDETGCARGFAMAVVDITERHAEERQREIIFEAAPNGMMIVNEAGIIVHANAELARIFGHAPGSLREQTVDKLVPMLRFADFAPAQGDGTIAPPAQVNGRRQNGTIVTVEITLNPVATARGRIFIASVIDVTARAEQQARLQQTQKMETVGRLTAGVAHDFNNLLQAQMGHLETLLDLLAGYPEARERVMAALDVTDRGARLTHYLLSYSRKQMLQPAAIDVVDFLADFKRMLPRVLGSQIEVLVETERSVAGVFADSAQLSTAILNLAINARDAMPHGGTLRIDARRWESLPIDAPPALAAGAYVAIGVADTGSGISQETIAQIFEPFFTTKGPSGTGLGLSMVQGFARQSGGDIGLTSVPGKGTRAQLWLPSVASPVVATVAVAAAPVQGTGRVLLVDDAADVRLLVGAFLSGAGFSVTEAAGGAQALAKLMGGEIFDALVTDYAMPGLTGRQLIARCLEYRPSLPVLLISGFPIHDDFKDLPTTVQVLTKPFRRDELVTAVSEMIERAALCEPG
jgi:PAS domain S-box-containing protein